MNSAAIYDKSSIASGLDNAVESVCDYVKRLNEDEFNFAPTGKWNAGQQLDHLIRSIEPLNLAYGLPVIILKWRFGVSNRPSKSYQLLVEKYESKLTLGGRASGRFIPKPVSYELKEQVCNKYRQEKEKLKYANEKSRQLDVEIEKRRRETLRK